MFFLLAENLVLWSRRCWRQRRGRTLSTTTSYGRWATGNLIQLPTFSRSSRTLTWRCPWSIVRWTKFFRRSSMVPRSTRRGCFPLYNCQIWISLIKLSHRLEWLNFHLESDQRWRTCVTDVDNALGFALGVMFVNETFDEKTKPEAEKMIRLVTKAFRWNSVQITFLSQKTAFSGLLYDHPVVLSS